MKYEKATAEIVKFKDPEFMTGSGNFDGGYCRNYSNAGRTCGYVEPCSRYGLGLPCNAWFECDEFTYFGVVTLDRGFLCTGFA